MLFPNIVTPTKRQLEAISGYLSYFHVRFLHFFFLYLPLSPKPPFEQGAELRPTVTLLYLKPLLARMSSFRAWQLTTRRRQVAHGTFLRLPSMLE